MRKRKVDANQKVIVDELRACGYSVITGHDDLIVGYAGITVWVEIKNPKGRNRLQPSQEKLRDEYRGAYLIARSAEDVIDWFRERVK